MNGRGRAGAVIACALAFHLHGCAKAAPALPAAAATLGTVQRLHDDLVAATRLPGVQRGAWGIAVQSLDRNDTLFELNPTTLLVPASTAKLLSVAAAATAVGWDYRFETTLRAGGPIADGILHGDLIVVGAGDPSIGGRGGDDLTVWVDALKALGIRRIDGRVIGDDDGFEEPRPALSWAWDDLGYSFGAVFGALNYAENRLAVAVTPAATPGGQTQLAAVPFVDARPLINRTVTAPAGSAPFVWPEQRPGEPFLTIAGSVPAGNPAPARLLVSAGNPTLWFARALRQRLVAGGVEVVGDAADIDDLGVMPSRTALPVLYTYRSHPLGEIVVPLLKESINLYAEAVMRLTVPPGTFPTNDAALDGLRARLAAWQIGRDGYAFVDGSGLSRRDVVDARTLVTVLSRMYDRTNASPWMTALPVAGVDGSLDNRMKGTAADGNVHAKTGSMSNIRSLAGYVTTREGEHLAFAILVNNFEGTAAQALQAIDAIAVRLAVFSR